MARRARRCARESTWVWRYAAPWARTISATSTAGRRARGTRHVAMFGALAGLDADRHAVGVDVRHPERNRLAHAQPCAIDGGEQQPMTWMRGRGEQSPHLFPAQNLRQFLRLLREGDVEVGARMTERHVIEE